VRFVVQAIERMLGGEVFVPKIPSMSIGTVVEAVAPGCKVREIGIRGGEKLHECLISEDEARTTRELEDMFLIAPAHPWWTEISKPQGRPVPEGFRYASDTNTSWITAEELRQLAGIPAPEDVSERGRSESLRRLQEALGASVQQKPIPAPAPKP
jgi:UDP-N-acetylglucosamine 4,6-dehydratase